MTDFADALAEAAHALREYKDHPYGPVVTDEMRPAAYDALERICSGNVHLAHQLGAQIVEDLGGYMPRGVVLALLRVAQANGQEAR